VNDINTLALLLTSTLAECTNCRYIPIQDYILIKEPCAAEFLDPASDVVEATWQVYAKCLHEGAKQTIENQSGPREKWVSPSTW
jgi:hypothetical protein